MSIVLGHKAISQNLTLLLAVFGRKIVERILAEAISTPFVTTDIDSFETALDDDGAGSESLHFILDGD